MTLLSENETKLSFCITTRNRSGYLRKTLESIIPQVTNQVEVVIVDGASTDDTEDVVGKYQREFPSIRYIRMAKNSGVDRDYNSSIEAARGEYCWFMSDDDLLKPGAVRTILDKIPEGHSLMVVNAEDWNADFTVRIGERRLPFASNRIYCPPEWDRFFIDTAHHLSFIPALVIRRDIWLSRNREKYFGSWFAHVGVVFQAPMPGNATLIAEPLIAIRNENISWNDRKFEIWMIRWPDLIWSFPNLPDSSKEKICSRNPSRNWRALLAYRASSAYSYKEYNGFIRPRTSGIGNKILPVVISVIPVSTIHLLSFLYRAIRR